LPKNAMMEAVVGLGGPIIGSLGALAAWIVYAINGHPIFLVLTYVGVLLNLFNLLPVLPLDGGRAVGVLSRWFWIIGFVFLVGAVVLLRNPFFLIILLFGAPEAWQRFRNRASEETEAYYQTPFAQRVAIGATYFGLIGVLGFALYHLGPVLVNGRPG
jgi:Zn-dependent protease